MAETLEIPAYPEIPVAEHPAGIEMVEWIFTNDKTNEYPKLLFHGLMQGAFANKLGIMQTKNSFTGEVDTLIVGIELVDGKFDVAPNCHPLAKILTAEEILAYVSSPDGSGNFS
jgi:hypothetical protein